MQLPFSLMYLWFLDRLVRVEGLQLARDSLDSNFQPFSLYSLDLRKRLIVCERTLRCLLSSGC